MSKETKAWISVIGFLFLLFCAVIGAKSQIVEDASIDDTVYCQIHGHIDNKILRGRFDRLYFNKQQNDTCYTDLWASEKRVIVVRPNCRPRKFKCLICGQKIVINRRDTLILSENEYYFY